MKDAVYEQLKSDLRRHEGERLTVYRDSEGYPTVGVGHLVLVKEQLQVGDVITFERMDELFATDLTLALQRCAWMIPQWQEHPDEVQCILANMSFNLGNRLGAFVRMLDALAAKDYAMVADEMQQSHWYTQVGDRGHELVDRMRRVAQEVARYGT